VELARRASAYRTSYAIDELDVQLDDGTALALMFKDLSRRALTAGADRAKPAFLHDPLREIEVYRSLLAPARLGTAICYGAVAEPERGRYWLFLERVAGKELYQVGEFAAWQHAARRLAALHGHFAAVQGERLAQTSSLLRYDGEFYRAWPRRARAFARSRPWSARVEWLADRYEPVIERLLSLPPTLIHGEFYASNVLVQDRRVCPVDWEMAAIGPGLVDLAALTAGRWTEEQRTALALAYCEAIPPHVGERLTPSALLDTLDYCRLHLALQWLGWSPDWTPPAEHAQDWLGEALRLAEKLGL
jgi:aminoglycoside phosphotransferase (APT) family kinase protein